MSAPASAAATRKNTAVEPSGATESRRRAVGPRTRYRAPGDPGPIDAVGVERGDGLAGGDSRCGHDLDVCGSGA